MTYKSLEIQKRRTMDEASFYKTPQIQQALAQLEATLSRKENQKVTEKSKNIKSFLCQEVSNL